MEVNWLKTMALAEGSACSILCTSSLKASILVLLWKSVVLMRLRMLLFLLLNAFAGDCAQCSTHHEPTSDRAQPDSSSILCL